MLEMFFAPQSVAVIGASRDPTKLGYAVLHNLVSQYNGDVYPINPQATEIMGLRCYPNTNEIPQGVDLAIIVVPPRFVPQIIERCGAKGVKGAIIITAGFREAGIEGVRAEKEVLATARQYGMRIIGPNCLGVISPTHSFNATFVNVLPSKGEIAFMSQSGGLGTAILDWAMNKHIGFSYFVSLGNKADINEGDLLEAWENDPHTKVIIAYIEGITKGQKFIEAARRVTRKTPFVVMKSGRTASGAKAVAAHTGALAGSEQVYAAMLKQCGIVRVNSVQELFDCAQAFAYQPHLQGDAVAIITNAGGAGIMAADAVEQRGLRIAGLKPQTIDFMRQHLPPSANIYNPIDLLGDATATTYEKVLDAVLKDETVHAVITIVTPQVTAQVEETARAIVRVNSHHEKPILTCFMGHDRVSTSVKILEQHQIPNYQFPEEAVNALCALNEHRLYQQRPCESTPVSRIELDEVREVLEDVRADGRLVIGDAEAREVMTAYNISVPRSFLARTPADAVRYAQKIGYPVVMKIASPDIVRKSEVEGIKMGLANEEQVMTTFDELVNNVKHNLPDAYIWGCQVQAMVGAGRAMTITVDRDSTFGAVLRLSMTTDDDYQGESLRIAPICEWEAREMIAELNLYHSLRETRDRAAADVDAVVNTLLRVSQLVTDFSEIAELEINPLIVLDAGEGVAAVDARLVLR